jgi:hypothetical protein
LRDSLRGVLNREQYKWGSLHEFLAEFAPPLIVANYDTLLEQALRKAGKPYELVIYPADRKDIANSILWWPHGASEPIVKKPNELDIGLGKSTIIYKIHGPVIPQSDEWDSFVITEENCVFSANLRIFRF